MSSFPLTPLGLLLPPALDLKTSQRLKDIRMLTHSAGYSTTEIMTWSALAGFAAHAVFRVREPRIVPLLAVLSTSFLGLFTTCLLDTRSMLRSFLLTSTALASFATSLYASMIGYRVFFSPLQHFPGPTLAAVSKFWYLYHSTKGRMPQVMRDLNIQYGNIVRIGPNELTIFSLDAMDAILSSKGKMTKGPWFDSVFANKGGNSVHALKVPGPHSQRRKYWDKAMTSAAMKEYLVFIKDCHNRLRDRIHNEYAEQPVQDIRRIMNHLVFDIMGEVGFAQSFGMIDNGKDHSYVLFVEKAMHALSVVAEIPWVIPILELLPIGKDQVEIEALSMAATLKRFEQGQSRPDLFSYFVQEDGQLHPDMTMKDLDAEVRAIIIAGSDTSSSMLTFIFDYLIQYPVWAKRLREEVDTHHRGHGDFDLEEMPILHAIVNETLRLRPPVPGRSQRIVPDVGVTICGQYIPAGTLVGIPQGLMMRDERYFSPSPEMWRPERWLKPDEEEIFNRAAFIPFSFGPFNCSGKNLGLLMVRYSLARLMLEFEITGSPQHDPVEFDKSIKEFFTLQKGPVWVVMKPRET